MPIKFEPAKQSNFVKYTSSEFHPEPGVKVITIVERRDQVYGAYQRTGPDFYNDEGDLIRKGDWILRQPTGEIEVLCDEDFKEIYRPY